MKLSAGICLYVHAMAMLTLGIVWVRFGLDIFLVALAAAASAYLCRVSLESAGETFDEEERANEAKTKEGKQ